MKLTRAWWLFFHPASARDDWERIDANMTIAISNMVIVVVMMIVVLGLKIWRATR